MSMSGLFNQTATFTPVSSIKTGMNRVSTIMLTGSAISVPCYITEVSFTPIPMGKKVIEYTHLLYTGYYATIANPRNYIVTVDSEQYTIEEVMGTYNNHHLEFGAKIIKE